MNKLFSMILCVTLISVLSACGGGGTKNATSSSAAKQGVTFSFSKDALVSTKATSKSVASAILDPAAVYAAITVTDTSGNVVLSNFRIDIYSINGSYITATVPLTPGNYQITQFLVLDSSNNVLYLVPTQSAAAEIKALVSSVLPISFGVTTDQANTVTVQVVAPENSTPQDFGYPSISFNIVNYVRFVSCVQIQNSTTQNWQLTDANLKVNGVNYSHPAQTTTLRVTEANGYTLVFSKTGYDTKTITLTAAEIANYQAAPLVVMLTPTVYRSVTFNSNGGTAVPPQSIATGGVAISPVNPSKTGYNFAGWYNDAALTNSFIFNTPITADITLYARWTASSEKVIAWTGPANILIDGSLRSSPYAVPAGRTTMTVRISGGAGGNAVNNAELRTFTGLPISYSIYTIIIGGAGADGEVVSNNAGGGGGGGGASTIKIGNLYVAGAAGGAGGGGVSGIDHESSSGGAGGDGDSPGDGGGASNTYSDQGAGGGGAGGGVNTGGPAVGGTVTGSGNGYLEIVTQ